MAFALVALLKKHYQFQAGKQCIISPYRLNPLSLDRIPSEGLRAGGERAEGMRNNLPPGCNFVRIRYHLSVYRCIIVVLSYVLCIEWFMMLLLSPSLYSPSKTQESSSISTKNCCKDVGGIRHTKNEEEVRKHVNTYYAPGKTRSTPAKGIAYS